MKVETIEQFHILEWLIQNFLVAYLNIELLDRHKIKITDDKRVSAFIIYTKNKSIKMETI